MKQDNFEQATLSYQKDIQWQDCTNLRNSTEYKTLLQCHDS